MMGTMQHAQMPAGGGGSPSPIALSDPKVESLKQMFPEIDADVLASMLAYSNGSLEEACAAILDVAPPVEDTDAAMARAMQQELDAEVARAVQDDLNKAAEAEAAEARAKDPTVRAAKAVESAASSTLSMLKKASARTLTAVGARRAAPSATHGARLLDASDEPSAFNFSPLQVPDYVASALAVPEPPRAAAPALLVQQLVRSPMLDLSDPSEWGAAPLVAPQATPPAAPQAAVPSTSDASPGDRYSSRLERARRSNAALNRSASVSTASSPPPPAPPAQPHVPMGDLI